MNKLILCFVAMMAFVLELHSQIHADCRLYYSYVGKINRKTVSDTSKIEVLLPGYMAILKLERKSYYPIRLDSNQNTFPKVFDESLFVSSWYCGTMEERVSAVFKKMKRYKIIFRFDKKVVQKVVKFKDIRFEMRSNIILVKLPDIDL